MPKNTFGVLTSIGYVIIVPLMKYSSTMVVHTSLKVDRKNF